MAKFTIQWCEIKKTGEKNGKPWAITKMHLRDEHGNLTEDVDTFDAVQNGATIEGEITTGQYGKNFVKAKAVAGSNFKTQQIEKAMDKKADQIAKAQDRSAWMWAKINASTLLAQNNLAKTAGIQELADVVLELATKIYNGEPTEPFS